MYTVTLNTPLHHVTRTPVFFFLFFLKALLVLWFCSPRQTQTCYISHIGAANFEFDPKYVVFSSLLFKFYFRGMAALTTWLQFNVNAAKSQPGRLFLCL